MWPWVGVLRRRSVTVGQDGVDPSDSAWCMAIATAASAVNKRVVVALYVPLFTLECDVICTSVWGCGRRWAAPAKSRAEQRTERWFIITFLRLNHLSEQHLGRVTMQVSSFFQDIFEMYRFTMPPPHLLPHPTLALSSHPRLVTQSRSVLGQRSQLSHGSPLTLS